MTIRERWLAGGRCPGALLRVAAMALVACSGTTATLSGANGDAGNGATDATNGDAPEMEGGGGGSDAPASGDGTKCALTENDAGTCNGIDAMGPMIAATCSSAEPPQAEGGAVEDGTYVLTAITHYGCTAFPDIASTTWVICGDHWDVAQLTPLDPTSDSGVLAPVQRLNFIASLQGTSIDLAATCGNTGLMTRGYTASGGKLTFIYTTNGQVSVTEYAKQ